MFRSYLDKRSSKNALDGLVNLIQKFTKLISEISSKMHKPKTYNEAVNNIISRNRW